MWKNAFLFNAPNHEVFKAAKTLAVAFEEKLSALHEKLDQDLESRTATRTNASHSHSSPRSTLRTEWAAYAHCIQGTPMRSQHPLLRCTKLPHEKSDVKKAIPGLALILSHVPLVRTCATLGAISAMWHTGAPLIAHACDSQEAPPCPLHARCQLLLSDLCGNCLSEWFRRDDWKQFGQGYRATIKSGQPMDLFAVQVWLDDQQCATNDEALVGEFARRVRLVWANAIDFNGSGSCFGVIAKLLSDTFERRLELLHRAPRPPLIHPPLEERVGWPTFPQKEAFYNHCASLSLRDASNLAQQVQRRCPTALIEDPATKTVTVDLDKVDLETFTHLEALARSPFA